MNIFERVRRAWKYRKTWRTPVGQDCISLDSALCEWLALRLAFLAEHHHSYPAHMTPDRWKQTLRKHAATFAAYELHWHAATLEAENDLIADAQKSMRWVANNLPTLWD